jgi:hypothetical protein
LEPYEGLRNFEGMKIIWCSNLVAFPSYFPRLKFLAIHQCSGLDILPDMRRFSELRRLELVDCEILSSLPEGITALKSLYIAGCPELEALPEGLQQRMPNLESFSIDDSFIGEKMQTWRSLLGQGQGHP